MTDAGDQRLIVGIPGPWENRTRFVQEIVGTSDGAFIFAGAILFDRHAEDHIPLYFGDADGSVAKAFRIAGQGRLSEETLRRIAEHGSVAYLHFPLQVQAQRLRILKFTRAVLGAGGFAVKLENSGAAHEAARWIGHFESGDLFELYCASVVLIGDDAHYYSCGMHQFSLPECQISKTMEIKAAAATINRFNVYQIAEQPDLDSGHTFSLTMEDPAYRLDLVPDHRHATSDLFHNRNGLWNLVEI